MGSFPNKLTDLQKDVIGAFFEDEEHFWLTGGAALAGYYLGHRQTHDVDLFGPADADIEEAARRAEMVATTAGAEVTRIRTTPTFVRLLLVRGDERCEVDVVRDTTPRVAPVEVKGKIRIDSLREIAANKVAALLSRSEVRDLVALRHLVLAGVDLDQALEDAAMKDAGLSPDTLALSLSWIPVEESRVLIADEDAETLRQFREELIRRFRAQAFPGFGPEAISGKK